MSKKESKGWADWSGIVPLSGMDDGTTFTTNTPYTNITTTSTAVNSGNYTYAPSGQLADGMSVVGPVDIDGQLSFKDNNGNSVNVGETLTAIKDRMLILEDDFKKHEEYPALKEAYDQYKMLEKLLGANNAKKD